jgi:hypothetical protein
LLRGVFANLDEFGASGLFEFEAIRGKVFVKHELGHL